MFKGLFQTKKNTPKAEIVWDLTDIDLVSFSAHKFYGIKNHCKSSR